jgi:hypothetical protein
MNVKTIFLEKITPFFRGLGYKYIAGGNFKFVLETERYIMIDSFNYLTNSKTLIGGKLNLSIKEIENIILEIKHPNKDFDGFLAKKNEYSITLGDVDGVFDIDNDFEFLTEEHIEYYVEKIEEYIQTDGQKFIETYSYLPNILKKMDELTAQGKTWQNRENGILSGSLDAEFRGLIIAKLCNDPNFQKKVEMCDTVFNESCYEEWLPYYEKLKERLKSVEPIYNV